MTNIFNGHVVKEAKKPLFNKKFNKGEAPYAISDKKIKVTLVKGTIGCLEDQIKTVEALGLTKIRSYKIHSDNEAIRGMIFKVKHLVKVEEVGGDK
jgi:large subunit ribosomal protein L30